MHQKTSSGDKTVVLTARAIVCEAYIACKKTSF